MNIHKNARLTPPGKQVTVGSGSNYCTLFLSIPVDLRYRATAVDEG